MIGGIDMAQVKQEPTGKLIWSSINIENIESISDVGGGIGAYTVKISMPIILNPDVDTEDIHPNRDLRNRIQDVLLATMRKKQWPIGEFVEYQVFANCVVFIMLMNRSEAAFYRAFKELSI